MGVIEWLWGKATEEWGEVKRVPFTIAVVLLLGLVVGWYAADRFYTERMAILQEKASLADRKAQDAAPSLQSGNSKTALFRSWGALTSQLADSSGRVLSNPPIASGCHAVLDTRDLEQYRDKYRFVLSCQADEQQGADPLTSRQVSFSRPYSVTDNEMTLSVEFSRQTREIVSARNAWVSMIVLRVPIGVDPSTAQTVSALSQMGAVPFGSVGFGVGPPPFVAFDNPYGDKKGVIAMVNGKDYWRVITVFCAVNKNLTNCPANLP